MEVEGRFRKRAVGVFDFVSFACIVYVVSLVCSLVACKANRHEDEEDGIDRTG